MHKNLTVISSTVFELWITIAKKSDVCKWRVLQSQSHPLLCNYKYIYIGTYQITVLPRLLLVQNCTLALKPAQSFPPQEGTGLLHFLLHCFVQKL